MFSFSSLPRLFRSVLAILSSSLGLSGSRICGTSQIAYSSKSLAICVSAPKSYFSPLSSALVFQCNSFAFCFLTVSVSGLIISIFSASFTLSSGYSSRLYKLSFRSYLRQNYSYMSHYSFDVKI